MDELEFNPLAHPIIFSVPRYLSGASAWVQHMPFAFLLTEMIRPATFVELGAYGGDSYLVFCQAIQQLGLQARCFAVDTWAGDAHSGFYGPEVLQWFRSRHDGVYAFSTLLQMEFDAACAKFENGQIDLLHIDGLHTYEAVKHDFENWLPKLSGRAVVLFHDTSIKTRDFGVWKLWEELSLRYPSFEFLHGCGLGILAVGAQDPSPKLLSFLKFANKNPQIVHEVFVALGERMEYLNQRMKMTAVLTEQAAHFRKLCQSMNVAWDFPTDLKSISRDMIACVRGMTLQIDQLIRALPASKHKQRP